MLGYKSLCVCEITFILQLSQSTVSGHLKVLKEAEIVEDIKNGLWVEYSLNGQSEWVNDIVHIIKAQSRHDSLLENDLRLMSRADRNQILCKNNSPK